MKSTYLIIISFFIFTATFAQKLSDEQINKYLNDLQKEEIISEFGKDALLKTIKNENKALNQRIAGSPLGALARIPDSLKKSRTTILGFIGIFELIRNVGSSADEMIQLREMSEKMLSERMFFKPNLEGEINVKKPITFLNAELNLRPVKENYISLANTLKSIGLIDKKVYDELLIWLKHDQIKLIKDFGFFIYAAKQTFFYDNYEALKTQQFKFIDSLQKVNLLKPEKAINLKDSYQPFELKNKVDILSFCENYVLIPSEYGIYTREEIYQNLFNQVKNKLIPAYNFNEFKVSELSKNEFETQEPNLIGMPFNNPLSNNNNAYKLTLKVNDSEYSQKADADFSFIKTLKKSIPAEINIESTVINSYSPVFSFLTGIKTKDFQSINDYLTDIHSSKRLIIINNDFNPFASTKDSRKILMLVDSVQNVVFEQKIIENQLLTNFSNEKPDFSDKFSKDNLIALIEDLLKIEVLTKIDKTEIENAILEVRFEPNNRKNIIRNLLLSFPQVIAKVNFSPKKVKDKTLIFKNFISELSRISYGKFIPEKVMDNFESEIPKGNKKDRNLKISYRLNGKKYEKEQHLPKLENDEFHNNNPMIKGLKIDFENSIILDEPEWLSFVNNSLEKNLIEGKFFKINNNYNTTSQHIYSNYIFLNKIQKEYIDTHHPLIFKDLEKPKIHENYQNQVSAFNAKTFAEALKKEKMLSEDSIKTLDLKNSKEPSEILKNSPQAFVIDLNELSGKSNTELYRYIISKFEKNLLPEAKFSEINYLKENTFDSTENDFEKQNISALINGKRYEQTLTVSLKNTIQNALDSLKNEKSQYFPSIGENQFKIINDYLTDIASPKRLVIVCDYRSPKLSFVLFDSTQANLVAETLPNNYVDFGMYSRQFSRDSLQKTLNEFSRMGLIEKMSLEVKDDFILRFRRLQGKTLSLLENLPKLVVQTNIWDMESYEKVYKNFIDSMKLISKGIFNSSNIEDNFTKMLKKSNYSDRNFKYSFKLNGKIYAENQFVKAFPKVKEKQEKVKYQVFDFDAEKLINLTNKALNDNNSDFTFYQIYSEEEEELIGPKIIFLSLKQHRWLKQKYPEIFESYDKNNSPDTDEIKEEK